jgi:hypothetical protein
VVEEPVELAQLPGSQAVVVRGALGQEGQSPADAVATAAVVAASRAAPAAAAGNEEAMTSDI